MATYYLNFYTTSVVGIKSLIAFDSSNNPVAISNVILNSATSNNASYATLISNSANNTQVLFTPSTNKIGIAFDCATEIYALKIDGLSNKYLISKVDFYGGINKLFGASNLLSSGNSEQININFIDNHALSSTIASNISAASKVNYYTTSVYISGTTSVNGTLRYKFKDSNNVFFDNWMSIGGTNAYNYGTNYTYALPPALVAVPSYPYSTYKSKEQSSLANLYAQQAPIVLNISVNSFDSVFDLITVTTDKECQVVVYTINQTSTGIEQSFQTFTRDSNSSTKIHTYKIPKVISYTRVVAVPTLTSFYRDFFAQTPNSSLNGYAYSSADSVVSRYQEGYDLGYKTAHQQLYALGSSYGWSFDFSTRTDYGNASVQQAFITQIDNTQYIKAYKELYNLGSTYGFTYNSSSTVPTYYSGLQNAYVNTLTAASAILTYKSLYNRAASYGFTYNNTSTDKSYYESQESSFVNAIDSFSDFRGYKRAYSELFISGRNTEIASGVPEGATAWVDETVSDPTTFYTRKDAFTNHVYNAGYVRAKQETFDRGIPFGYNFRTFITPGNKSLTNQTLLTDYLNQGQNFIDTVTANAKATGYKDIYDYANTLYGFTYNSTNSTNLSISDYTSYLSGLKVSMVDKVTNDAKVATYKDIYATAASEFLFSNYDNTSTSASYYASRKDAALGQVYNYGARSAYQSVYDRGTNYFFNTTTDYTSRRNSSYILKNLYNDTETTHFDSLKNDFELRLYESGVIYTYKRFYDLALIYGFTYDGTQYQASYYDGKKEEFLDIYRSGNFSEGMKFVFDTAKTRYNFNYTYSINLTNMKAQVVPMFDFIDNQIKIGAYKYTLDTLNSNTFYNIPYSDTSTNSADYVSIINSNLTSLKNSSQVEIYNLFYNTANTRDGYIVPVSSSATTLSSQVVPMFKYVEDYKEADGYRRVHNYAKNFLNIGYTFTDSQDPRVLENQVPALFDYLMTDGGVGAYKYVLETAHIRLPGFNYTYYTGISALALKNQIPGMFDYMFNTWGSTGYKYIFEFVNYPYTPGTPSELQNQVGDLFDFINLNNKDVVNVAGPTKLGNNRVKFVVTLKRNTTLIAILTDKTTGSSVDFINSNSPNTIHEIILKYPGVKGQEFGVIFVPGAENYTVN